MRYLITFLHNGKQTLDTTGTIKECLDFIEHCHPGAEVINIKKLSK